MFLNYSNTANMSLPKLDRKLSQRASLNIVNVDKSPTVASSTNKSVQQQINSNNEPFISNSLANSDEYNFPHLASSDLVQPSEQQTSANLARTHSYRLNSYKEQLKTSLTKNRSILEKTHTQIPLSPPFISNSFSSDAVSSKEALVLYKHCLTDYEKSEILEYSQVYFVGPEAEKIHVSSVREYCDDNGTYRKVRYDHIAYRYEVFETLGSGSFGLVVKCYDHKNKELVAIKIIRNRKKLEQQGMVEVKLLNHVKSLDADEKANLVHIKEYFYFRNHLCISFELLGMNLYEVIKKNQFQGFTSNLVRKFAYAILQCLKLLYRERIIHCDLKPENILIRQKSKNSTSCSLKVCDFGSGTLEHEKVYTYIQSRFYRAPEVILGIPYTMAIDMWSLGCILAELYSGHPIFPGTSETDQLNRIIEVIGMPASYIIDVSSRAKLFFDSKGSLKETKSARKIKPDSRPLKEIYKDTDPNFLDFLRRCLEWDPQKRLTPEEGLKHPWIMEAKLQKAQSIKRDKRPKHRLKREESNMQTQQSNGNGYQSANNNPNNYTDHSSAKQRISTHKTTTNNNNNDDDEYQEFHKKTTYLPPI